MTGMGFDADFTARTALGDQVVALPSGEGRGVQIVGLKEALKMLNEVSRDLKAGGADNPQVANQELRQAARQIADRLEAKVKAAPGAAPQTAAVRQTARARNDRTVKVVVPGTNIPFGSGSVGGTRRGAIAFGANYGPAGSVNYYRVPRNAGGYFIEPATRTMIGPASDEYQAALTRILRKYGVM